MPVREIANPIPVLMGSEYRDRKTMKKHVRQNTTGMKIGTCWDKLGLTNVTTKSVSG